MSDIYQIYEDDLQALETMLPKLMDDSMAHLNNAQRFCGP